MKRISAIVCLGLFAGAVAAAPFPSNTVDILLDLANQSSDFNDFRKNLHGFSDYIVTFTITNSASAALPDYTGYYAMFTTVRCPAGSSNRVTILKGLTDTTVAGNTIGFLLSHTNLPDDGSYNAELILTDSPSTNNLRILGRGKWTINHSLFRE